MATTPPSAARAARRAHAGVSLQASMADPEGSTDQAPHRDQGQPGGRTREAKRRNCFTMPRDAMPALLSSFRLLTMASPHWMLVGNS